MPETNLNPFTSSNTASAYVGADPVYAASTEHVINFAPPLGSQIADLGAGTGVSSEIIYRKLLEINTTGAFTLIEPSEAMLNEAHSRMGDAIKYLNAGVDQLPTESFDLIYALNCFHLFPDHNSAASSISKALQNNGTFVFNLSSPSFKFSTLSDVELDVLYANLDFYAELHDNSGGLNPILASTIQLLTCLVTAISYNGREDEIIEGIGVSASDLLKRARTGVRGLYSQDELANIFKAASMDLEGYTEVLIRVPAEYQQNIWRMMAKAFIQDDHKIEEIISKVKLPEEVPIRQAIFKLCKN